eukprot:1160697-Pelagomonas_calceolata.AAC.5
MQMWRLPTRTWLLGMVTNHSMRVVFNGMVIIHLRAHCTVWAWSSCARRRENYVGREKSLYINQEEGDTLAQKSRESSPPQSYRAERASGEGYWKHLAPEPGCDKFFLFKSKPSGNKHTGVHNRMGMRFASKCIGTLVVKSQLFLRGGVVKRYGQSR